MPPTDSKLDKDVLLLLSLEYLEEVSRMAVTYMQTLREHNAHPRDIIAAANLLPDTAVEGVVDFMMAAPIQIGRLITVVASLQEFVSSVLEPASPDTSTDGNGHGGTLQ